MIFLFSIGLFIVLGGNQHNVFSVSQKDIQVRLITLYFKVDGETPVDNYLCLSVRGVLTVQIS